MNKIIGILSLILLIFSHVKSESVIPLTSFPNLPLNMSMIIVITESFFDKVPFILGLGACFCDLTVGLCDINCCCDTSCSAADNASFTICIDQQIAQNMYDFMIDKYCLN